MKRLFLPLILVSPILTALAPHADAAAITFDSGALRSQLPVAASFQQRIRAGVPSSVLKMPAAPKLSNAINNSLLFGSTLRLNGGIVRTGAGTIALDGTNAFSGGTLNALMSVGSGDGTRERHAQISIDTNGFDVRINSSDILSAGTTTLIDGLSGGLLKTGTGTLTLNGTGTVNVNNGSGTLTVGVTQTLSGINIGSGGVVVLNPNSSPLAPTGAGSVIIAPAPAQVPEPGTAVLFAIGMLAASQARRRRAF